MAGVVRIAPSVTDRNTTRYVVVGGRISSSVYTVWFRKNLRSGIWSNDRGQDMNDVLEKELSSSVGEQGAKILKAVFAIPEIKKAHLDSDALSVQKAKGRWSDIDPKILAAFKEAGFRVIN